MILSTKKRHRTNQIKAASAVETNNKVRDFMKKIFLGTILTLVSANALASVGVYNCKLVGGDKQASLVYYPDSQRVTWMPYSGLKTTQANALGHLANNGKIEFTLFAFQDQADMLVLPVAAKSLPQNLNIQTYRDDDDDIVDIQNFICTK
jgi:hypothetical protein